MEAPEQLSMFPHDGRRWLRISSLSKVGVCNRISLTLCYHLADEVGHSGNKIKRLLLDGHTLFTVEIAGLDKAYCRTGIVEVSS